jgi:hypothetical protein
MPTTLTAPVAQTASEPVQKLASATFSVLLHSTRPINPAAGPAAGAAVSNFSYPTTLQGSTTHFTVYYDPTLGAAGVTLAKGVLARCETDYSALSAIFGGLQPAHFNIILAPGIGGAYHANCSATDIYCDGETTESTDAANFLVVAEECEVFQAVQNKGWNCGWSNGEGLSRTLATLQYPAQLDGFTSATTWLNTAGRPNWIDQNEQTDRDYVSIGCSTLFLNYLVTQLGFSWAQVTQTAGSTLNVVYGNLTHSLNGYAQFTADLQGRFPAGTNVNLPNDNPFPIQTVAIKNILTETADNSIGGAYMNGRTYIAWEGTDGAHHLNVMSSGRRAVWQNKVTLGDTSSGGCSLCVFNNRLYLAWTGTGNNEINFMSSTDGVNWGNKVTLGETCVGRPALAAVGNHLVVAWTGTDAAHHINVLSSTDGVNWGSKHELGDTATDAPAIASFGGRLYLAWSGTDNPHHVNVESSADLGASWQNKVTLGETSIASPSLLSNGNELYLSWSGTDAAHHLNVLQSTNGTTFVQKVTEPELSNSGPTLALAYGAPAFFWTGTDSHLNVWTF